MWLTVNPFAEAAYYGGVDFPSGVLSFADRVVLYEPDFGDGLLPDIVQQDARQILGVPGQGEMSLGNGGNTSFFRSSTSAIMYWINGLLLLVSTSVNV